MGVAEPSATPHAHRSRLRRCSGTCHPEPDTHCFAGPYHEERVYFAAPDGLVGCLRASDGRPLWSLNVIEKFAGRGHDFGYACSPVVEDGKLLLPVGGENASVVALDPRDGSTLWASGSDPASYCSVLPIAFRGRRLVVAFLENSLVALDRETGRPVWRESYSRGYDEHSAMPLYREPHLMALRPFRGGADLFRFDGWKTPETSGDEVLAVTRVRHTREMSNDVASSVLLDGFVYGFDLQESQTNRHRASRGAFKCMEFLSGKVRWTSDRPGHAAIAAADGKLYLLNDRGVLTLVRANPERYEELGRADVFAGEQCWTAPTLCQGRLYLRSPTRAVCLYVGLPEGLAEDRRGRTQTLAEVPKPRAFDAAWLVGGEREFPYDAPDRVELLRWYVYSLGGLLVAAVLGAMTAGTAGRRWPGAAARAGWTVFFGSALVLGFALTPLANRFAAGFVFTWPVALFAAQQVALMAIVHAREVRRSGQDNVRSGWENWRSLAALGLFFAVALATFDLSRRLTLAITWVFLMGFLPSWPLAIPAAIALLRSVSRSPGITRSLLALLLTLAAFTLYFWTSTAFLLLRTLALR
jgi:hypothetical protein